MTDARRPNQEPTQDARLGPAALQQLLAEQRRRWRQGECVRAEDFYQQEPLLHRDAEAVLQLVYNEVVLREQRGERPGLEEFLARFPHLAEPLRLQFEVDQALGEKVLLPTRGQSTTGGGSAAARGAADPERVGDYEILGELGRGGMGVVYQARQARLQRLVAVKMILAGVHAEPASRARFRREAVAVARLQHPHIVQVHEVGEHDGQPFFSLEFCAGGSLEKQLAGGHRFGAREAAALTETLARAIHHAHQHGIVHRDLKPANVLLTADGTPKIADFGLARLLDGDARQTQSGAVLGTPSYMAPEQAAGQGQAVGPAADVYALGAILYELLTGSPPFTGRTPLETLRQVLDDTPERPRRRNPQVDGALEAICLKCLEKDPEARYPSAAALAEDLAAFQRGEPLLADSRTRLRLLQLVLRETRHTEIMARWGVVLMWHAGQIFLLSAGDSLLLGLQVETPGAFLLLQTLGMGSLFVPVWYYRFRGGPPLTAIERQLAQVWVVVAVAVILCIGIQWLRAPPPGAAEAWALLTTPFLMLAVGFGCTAAILGGSFYVLAVACAGLAVLTAVRPDASPLVFGTVFGLGLFVPGWRFSRAAGPGGAP
jgi:serine/threonine-protein kinase